MELRNVVFSRTSIQVRHLSTNVHTFTPKGKHLVVRHVPNQSCEIPTPSPLHTYASNQNLIHIMGLSSLCRTCGVKTTTRHIRCIFISIFTLTARVCVCVCVCVWMKLTDRHTLDSNSHHPSLKLACMHAFEKNIRLTHSRIDVVLYNTKQLGFRMQW